MMNSAQDSAWPQTEQTMDIGGQDIDFSNLLDFTDVDMSGLPLEPDVGQTSMHFSQQPPNTPYSGDISAFSGHAIQDFATQDFDMSGMGQEHAIHSQGGSHTDLSGFAQSMNQPMWNTASHSGMSGGLMYRHPNQIPPTPNSYEMHGGDPAQYNQQQMDAQAAAYLEQRFQQQKSGSFTPLVSPAVTPQDTQFARSAADYALPSAYFSPLTSPALQAQAAGRMNGRHMHSAQPSTAGSSAAGSPINPNFDFGSLTTDSHHVPDQMQQMRRTRSKPQTPRSKGSGGSLRETPASKPRKRKSEVLSGAVAQHALQNQTSASSRDSSGADSISPEPLSESLMGPPPRPGSTLQSPVITAHTQSKPVTTFNGSRGAPATPASLMSIDNSKKASASSSKQNTPQQTIASRPDSSLDDLSLPPSAASDPAASQPEKSSKEATPRIAARKTPKLGPLSTASSSIQPRPGSATSSPSISAITSPQSATTPVFGKDAKARKGSKRGSISGGSNMVSPALRPKISPSIKPLLPEGAALDSTSQALLLASKSNYTHLLEGTLLPGVSYPDSLSSGLTSKRTSHKIAEQGRRNRINEALKEMQSLLPSPSPKSINGKAPSATPNGLVGKDGANVAIDGTPALSGAEDNAKAKGGSAAASAEEKAASDAKAANSKAATVESAIDYIKLLKMEHEILAKTIRDREDEVETLRRRLDDAERRLGGTGSGSEGADERSEHSGGS